MGTYSALSRLMSDHPEALIIRSFSELQIRSLLYYQAELAELEAELEEIEREDCASSDVVRKNLSSHWKSLTATGSSSLTLGDEAASQDVGSRQQWKLVLRIRDALKEYSKQGCKGLSSR
jgi:hypothetical protein